MSKRTVTRWAQKQYRGDVQLFPRWSLAVGVLVLIALKANRKVAMNEQAKLNGQWIRLDALTLEVHLPP